MKFEQKDGFGDFFYFEVYLILQKIIFFYIMGDGKEDILNG